VDGRPAGRGERLAVCWKFRDTLAVQCHRDAAGLSDGQAWQKYAKASSVAGWLPETTVELVIPLDGP
jgi:hypothetical protein